MIVSKKNKSKKNLLRKLVKNKLFYIFSSIILFLYIFLQYVVTDFRSYIYDKGYRAINEDSIKSTLKRIPVSYIKSCIRMPEVPELKIDINYKNFSKLRDKVNASLKLGFIHKDEAEEAKATIDFNGTEYEVNLRIKGDNLDHIQGNKWSLRCKIRDNDKYLLGMKYFSIQNPKVRGFHGQKFVDEIRRHYGLITPRRFYVKVVLNGSSIGLMEIEEHFSKEMIEFSKRKEAPVLKFDEDDYWKFGDSYDWTNSHIDVFQKSKTYQSNNLGFYAKRATALLHGLSRETMRPSEVFDVEELSTYLAVSQFLGVEHGVRWGNVRYYYNPYLDKIQPIGYDDNFNERLPFSRIIDTPFFMHLLGDKVINDNYLKKLKKIISEFEKGIIVQILKKIENNNLEVLRKEFFLLEEFDISYIEKRKNYILEKIFNEKNYRRIDKNLKKLQIFYYIENNNTNFEFINTSSDSIIVEDLCYDIDNFTSIDLKIEPFEVDKLTIPDTLSDLKYFRVSTEEGKDSFQNIKPYLQYRQFNHRHNKNDYLNSLIERKVFSVRDNSLFLNEGNWTLSKNLFVDGYEKLTISGAINLSFDGCGMIASTPVIIQGTEGQPVVVKGVNGGGFILVYDASSESKVDRVQFSDLCSMKTSSQLLTGSISFYNSDVDIRNTDFRSNNSEDMLNIINSDFKIFNVSVMDTKSDGIDLDYSNGFISQSSFHSIGKTSGGDAIDLSGSDVFIEDCTFQSVGDKAISAGESSLANLSSIRVSDSSVGIVSKDRSLVNASKVEFSNIKFKQFMCYIKKIQYGPASMNIEGDFSDETKILCQEGSSVILNGKKVRSVDVDVEQLYETIMFSDKN